MNVNEGDDITVSLDSHFECYENIIPCSQSCFQNNPSAVISFVSESAEYPTLNSLNNDDSENSAAGYLEVSHNNPHDIPETSEIVENGSSGEGKKENGNSSSQPIDKESICDNALQILDQENESPHTELFMEPKLEKMAFSGLEIPLHTTLKRHKSFDLLDMDIHSQSKVIKLVNLNEISRGQQCKSIVHFHNSWPGTSRENQYSKIGDAEEVLNFTEMESVCLAKTSSDTSQLLNSEQSQEQSKTLPVHSECGNNVQHIQRINCHTLSEAVVETTDKGHVQGQLIDQSPHVQHCLCCGKIVPSVKRMHSPSPIMADSTLAMTSNIAEAKTSSVIIDPLHIDYSSSPSDLSGLQQASISICKQTVSSLVTQSATELSTKSCSSIINRVSSSKNVPLGSKFAEVLETVFTPHNLPVPSIGGAVSSVGGRLSSDSKAEEVFSPHHLTPVDLLFPPSSPTEQEFHSTTKTIFNVLKENCPLPQHGLSATPVENMITSHSCSSDHQYSHHEAPIPVTDSSFVSSQASLVGSYSPVVDGHFSCNDTFSPVLQGNTANKILSPPKPHCDMSKDTHEVFLQESPPQTFYKETPSMLSEITDIQGPTHACRSSYCCGVLKNKEFQTLTPTDSEHDHQEMPRSHEMFSRGNENTIDLADHVVPCSAADNVMLEEQNKSIMTLLEKTGTSDECLAALASPASAVETANDRHLSYTLSIHVDDLVNKSEAEIFLPAGMQIQNDGSNDALIGPAGVSVENFHNVPNTSENIFDTSVNPRVDGKYSTPVSIEISLSSKNGNSTVEECTVPEACHYDDDCLQEVSLYSGPEQNVKDSDTRQNKCTSQSFQWNSVYGPLLNSSSSDNSAVESLHPVSRLEQSHRPLRIGLSRKQKVKSLHCHHSH